MKKSLLTTICAAAISLSLCVPAFAGQWKSDNSGWWWQEDDGSYPVSQWKWLDGNNDGIAECYYFNEKGYMLSSTQTPDGYTVNDSGARVENGVVQTQAVNQTQNTAPAEAQTQANAPDVSGKYAGSYNGKPIRAEFFNEGNETWAEVDNFLKDYLPPYKGNGLFENDWNSFQFSEDKTSLIFKDLTTGESVSFVRQ